LVIDVVACRLGRVSEIETLVGAYLHEEADVEGGRTEVRAYVRGDNAVQESLGRCVDVLESRIGKM
jgi:hypothetical protein